MVGLFTELQNALPTDQNAVQSTFTDAYQGQLTGLDPRAAINLYNPPEPKPQVDDPQYSFSDAFEAANQQSRNMITTGLMRMAYKAYALDPNYNPFDDPVLKAEGAEFINQYGSRFIDSSSPAMTAGMIREIKQGQTRNQMMANHGVASFLGTALGVLEDPTTLLTFSLNPVAGATTALGKIGLSALTGAAFGGLTALTAPQTDYEFTQKDALSTIWQTALIGGALGAAGLKVGDMPEFMRFGEAPKEIQDLVNKAGGTDYNAANPDRSVGAAMNTLNKLQDEVNSGAIDSNVLYTGTQWLLSKIIPKERMLAAKSNYVKYLNDVLGNGQTIKVRNAQEGGASASSLQERIYVANQKDWGGDFTPILDPAYESYQKAGGELSRGAFANQAESYYGGVSGSYDPAAIKAAKAFKGLYGGGAERIEKYNLLDKPEDEFQIPEALKDELAKNNIAISSPEELGNLRESLAKQYGQSAYGDVVNSPVYKDLISQPEHQGLDKVIDKISNELKANKNLSYEDVIKEPIYKLYKEPLERLKSDFEKSNNSVIENNKDLYNKVSDTYQDYFNYKRAQQYHFKDNYLPHTDVDPGKVADNLPLFRYIISKRLQELNPDLAQGTPLPDINVARFVNDPEGFRTFMAERERANKLNLDFKPQGKDADLLDDAVNRVVDKYLKNDPSTISRNGILFQDKNLRQRTFHFTNEEILPFLKGDALSRAGKYITRLNTAIELRKTFGKDFAKNIMDRIDQDYNDLKDRTSDSKEYVALDKERGEMKEIVTNLINFITGDVGFKHDTFSNIVQLLKNYNYIRVLGQPVFKHLPLIIKTKAEHLVNLFDKDLSGWLPGFKTTLSKLSKSELNLIGATLDQVGTHGSSQEMYNIWHTSEDGLWKANKIMQRGVHYYSIANLLEPFNVYFRTLAANEILPNMMKLASKLMDGTLAKDSNNAIKLRNFGIDERNAPGFLEQYKKHATIDNKGVVTFNLDKWEDGKGLDLASLVRRQTNRVMGMPMIGDQPFVVRKGIGSALTQFLSLQTSLLTRSMLANFQDLGMGGMFAMKAVARMISATVSGAIMSMVQDAINGREVNTTPTHLAIQGLERGGVLPMIDRFGPLLERYGLGLMPDDPRVHHQHGGIATEGWMEGVLGPTFNLLNTDGPRALNAAYSGNFNQNHLKAIARMAPMQNFWLFSYPLARYYQSHKK